MAINHRSSITHFHNAVKFFGSVIIDAVGSFAMTGDTTIDGSIDISGTSTNKIILPTYSGGAPNLAWDGGDLGLVGSSATAMDWYVGGSKKVTFDTAGIRGQGAGNDFKAMFVKTSKTKRSNL